MIKLFLFCLLQVVHADSLAGISMADNITVENETLILNGLGLREKYWVDVYVAGLYLPQKMSNGDDIIKANITKRIQVEFIYSSVPQAKMIVVLEENILPTIHSSLQKPLHLFANGSWMQDFTSGDVVMFDYNPTTQTTTIYINGSTRGSIQM